MACSRCSRSVSFDPGHLVVVSKRAVMKSIYCTVMSRPFVPRALTLQDSIARHSPDAQFAFFCIDDATAALLKTFDLKNAWIVAPDEFETPALRAVKPSLKPSEYCWTCKS